MKIKLHTPAYLGDHDTITEYEANDIIHVEAVRGRSDDSQGTHFWFNGIPEQQF